MTREEAIKIIKECREKGFKYTFYTVNDYHAAMEMAINALENENVVTDRVLEIIDAKHDDFCDGSFRDNSITYAQAWKRSNEAIRDAVLSLQGGQSK